MSAPAMQPQECPRVDGATDDGKKLRTCGELDPCPIHGSPTIRLVPAHRPTEAGA